MLNEKQKKQLRRMAHTLHPLVRLGNAGLTEAIIAAIKEALDSHELIKVKMVAGDRGARDQAIQDITDQCDAELIQQIGHIAVIYRQHPKKPIINI